MKLKELKQKNRKAYRLTLTTIILFLLLIIGTTFAYFTGFIGDGQRASIQANTGTTDSLTFIAGEPIKIHATEQNFAEGMESLSGSTHATAKLMPNNSTYEASGRYNIFFVIEENDFEYSNKDGKTELLLKVTDPNGNEVENITNLKRVENGFDITTRSGAFLIIADYDIKTNSKEGTEQKWNFEVTLVNLNDNQDSNRGKKLNGYVYITTEQISTYEAPIINAVESSTTYNSIATTLNITSGSSEIDKYYYAIEEDKSSLAYTESKVKQMKNEIAITDDDFIESDSIDYTFENLKENTTYTVYSYTKDKQGVKSNIYQTDIKTEEYIVPTITQVLVSNSTLTSLTVDATATGGTTKIVKYLYSINNGAWQESNTFSNLKEDTEYTIKIKAVDEKERESEEFSITARTVKYNLPTIKNVTTSTTSSSITVNIEAQKGDANVSKYYFNINNEWKESDNNSYTFNNLTSNTDYSIKVKVSDTNNRESAEGVATAKTDYVLPTVNSITHTSTLYSITVTANATKGSNEVSKYYFSKDNGATWTTGQTSNSYTFDNLLDTTEYKIKVKVSDTDERFSTEYYEAIATATYINPSITTVTTSSKAWNSITLQTTATKGSNNVSKYYYSKDGGATWSTPQTSNTYTITGLNEETEYNILVKVEDTNGRFSNVYSSYKETTNQYKVPTISVTSSKTYNSITLNATTTKGDGNIKEYWYSKDGGSNWVKRSITTLTDNYTFNNLTSEANFSIQVKVIDSNNRESNLFSSIIKTDKKPLGIVCSGQNMAQCMKTNYTLDNKLLLHDSNLVNGAKDNSLRYAGASKDVNNYICFGSEEMPCPDENKYRIIGVFEDKLKLIKSTEAKSSQLGTNGAYESDTTYRWDQSNSQNYNNTWSKSKLNTVNLNTNFLDNIGSTWTERIATTTWQVGGMNLSTTNTAKQYYDVEVGTNKVNTTYEAKIGLIYVSDYGYAASPENWTKALYTYNDTITRNNNWMFIHNYEWTISRHSIYSDGAFYINAAGDVSNSSLSYSNAIRPVFYLVPTIKLASGIGTYDEPYRIEIDNTTTSCFTAGTKIQIESGYKNIENINIGDKVYSYNEKTKKIELSNVERIIEKKADHINVIKVGNEEINVTDTHPMYAKKKGKSKTKWTKVSELKEGDFLFNENGEFEEIKSIKRIQEETTVYNMTVAGNHNYYITKDNYLVHNKDSAPEG